MIRVAMGVEQGGYLENSQSEADKVKVVVDAAIARNDVIDWHDHNAHQHQDAAQKFLAAAAQHYGKYPNVIYETYNEPLNVHSWAENIKSYHSAIIQTIREHDSDNLIVCGTPHWCQKPEEAARDPLPFTDIAYALHFYAGTHKQPQRDAAAAALKSGVALFVTEFGTSQADGGGKTDFEETKKWWDFLEENQISWCNWSIADKAESSAALRPGADFFRRLERWGHSYVSSALRRDTTAALRALVAHVESSPAGKAVAGYHVPGGADGQFFPWSGYDAATTDFEKATYHLADYSPAPRDAFRDWLRRKYKTQAALRAVWNQPNASFETAIIPSGERRLAPGFFFNGKTDQDIADYNRFYSEGTVETIHGYARILKKASKNQKPISTYWKDTAARVEGHSATAKMLQSQDIDFLAGPTDYGVRMPGEVGASHSVFEELERSAALAQSFEQS